MKILFVGGGNMCQAIIGGLMARGTPGSALTAIEPLPEARAALEKVGVSADGEFHVRHLGADTVILAVKPQMMKAAVSPLAGKLGKQLVISIAAGIRSADLAQWLALPSGGSGAASSAHYGNIVRAMPNTPALIRAGITGLFAMPGVNPAARAEAESLLGAVGKTAWFEDEPMLDAVTAVSGSGPAYVFYFIEALEQAAQELGFDAPIAREFALQTFLGSAKLAADSTDAPAVLRAKVTSKGGTTARAIETFDALELKRNFIAGVKAACHRSHELGDEMSRESARATGKS